MGKFKENLDFKLKDILILYNEKIEPITLHDSDEIDDFFFKISNGRGFLDPLKLKTIIYDTFKEFSDKVYPVIQKIFGHFKVRINYK